MEILIFLIDKYQYFPPALGKTYRHVQIVIPLVSSSLHLHVLWKVKVLDTLLCMTFCHPMDYSPPGSSVHGILQSRILEWVAIPSPGNIPGPGIKHRSPELQAESLLSESPTCSIHLPKWFTHKKAYYFVFILCGVCVCVCMFCYFFPEKEQWFLR